jgi:hypothetical protein
MQKFGGVSEGHTNSCAQNFRIAGTKVRYIAMCCQKNALPKFHFSYKHATSLGAIPCSIMGLQRFSLPATHTLTHDRINT